MSPTRAVVADDSHCTRSVITRLLSDDGIEVVAQARNGREAVDAVRDHAPDVVTMDVEMPEMDGIEAVERIMAEQPTPVLMLSAHTHEDSDVTFRALENGAVDFFPKPGGEVSMEISRLRDQFVEGVRSVAAAEPGATVTVPASGDVTPGTPEATAKPYVDNPTLVVGSSTGGPTVVERLLSELPLDADFRVLVVQHMPASFTGRFARRLDSRSEYDIAEASDGDRIAGGQALIAPGSHHMQVANYTRGRLRVSLDDDPPVNSVRPSVDVTMESAADVVDGPLVGVVLTGMGADGAAGIEALKRVGARTVVQDEASSAVFGMPKRATETGCVDAVEPIDSMTDAVLEAIATGER